jgi:archaellin
MSVLWLRRRGVAGLDALIIFIAILLVASVVGTALLSTSKALVNKDKAVSAEKSKSIQRPILVESLRGSDTDGDRRLDELIFLLRLREGDESVRFNETILIVNSKAVNCTSIGYGLDASENCTYGVSYVKRGHDFEVDRLSMGDLVEVVFRGPNVIGGVEDNRASFIFIPSHGMQTEIKAHMPERVTKNNHLWPLND